MDNDLDLETEIIETTRHLISLITLYVLVENTPIEAYYSDLGNRLEKLTRIIEWERNKQNEKNRDYHDR